MLDCGRKTDRYPRLIMFDFSRKLYAIYLELIDSPHGLICLMYVDKETSVFADIQNQFSKKKK